MELLNLARLRSLPKVDLHRHLDCSMRWSTLVELAPQVGIELPKNQAEWANEFLVTSPMKDLDSVLRKFLNIQKVLASPEILERLAFEACEDAFNDGVRLLELRYAPTFIADGHSLLTFEKIHQAIEKGLQRARKSFPMAVGLIGTIQRIRPFDTGETVTDFIIDHKDSFVGIDLADNEEGFDPKIFAPLFHKAKKAGIHVTVHSGESPQDVAAAWVKDSIDILGAERIGHGVQIIRDPEVLEFVRQKKIPLEMCPISNWLTQAFPTFEAHPARELWEKGILLTINSDDPGVFGTTLTDDYNVMARVHGFGFADFEMANDIAAAASFIPLKDRQKSWPRPILSK